MGTRTPKPPSLSGAIGVLLAPGSFAVKVMHAAYVFGRYRMDDQHDALPPDSSQPINSGAEGPAPNEAGVSREVLKSAYNAFKKRWKLTRLDHESRIGRGPLSSGQKSAIVGIAAPKEFPRAVWEELVKQGRLKHAGSGLYAMP